MELKQLEYIVKIAEERNVTKAAEKMYITQSALNQQLLKLEKELGSQLFYRSRTNWKLTEIGEIYIKNAEKILNIKKETYDQINDLLEKHKGNLRIENDMRKVLYKWRWPDENAQPVYMSAGDDTRYNKKENGAAHNMAAQ